MDEVAALQRAGAHFLCARCQERVARIWTAVGDYICRKCNMRREAARG